MYNAPQQVPGAEQGDDGGMTVFLFGPPGTRKTTWAAQWPGVVFISLAAEGGDDALGFYPEIAQRLINESQIKECPPVFNAIQPNRFLCRTTKQVIESIDYICANAQQLGIFTVCVDGLCYLVDLWIDEYIKHAEKNNPGWVRRVKKQGGDLLNMQEWGLINMFLRSLRVKMQNAGLNVIWTTLSQEIYTQQQGQQDRMLDRIVPMVPGKNRITLPGACKLHIYAEPTKIPSKTALGRMEMQPTFWTSPSSQVDLRHKYLDRFPQGCLMDPEFGKIPTFRAVWYVLHQFIYVGRR